MPPGLPSSWALSQMRQVPCWHAVASKTGHHCGMAVLGIPSRAATVAILVGGAGFAVLVSLAARADVHTIEGSPALTALDLTVGFAFVFACLLGTGAPSERLMVGAVGLAWTAGSVFASARSLHQGVLVIALLAFPKGRVLGVPRRLLGVAAVVVAFEVVPQLGVAALFAAVSVVALVSKARARPAPGFPAAAAAAVGVALVFAGWAVRHSTVVSPLVLYEATLIAVAIGFPLATLAAARSRARLADRVLGDERFSGLPGLRLVLAEALDDPHLRVDLRDEKAGVSVAQADDQGRGTRSKGGVRVFDGDLLLAKVITTSPAVDDGPTAEGVSAAVRLAVMKDRLLDQQAQQVEDLEASRVRLLAATDSERERVATRLRNEAGARLQEARATLATARPVSDPDLSRLIGFALAEVTAAVEEVQRIVAGVPPTALGAGALRGAIASLAGRSPAQLTLNLAADAAADSAVETTLFYVCSEALANVSKHAGATSVSVDLQRDSNELLLRVRDDGRGGADLGGSGLLGLVDRLAAVGGHLAVSSPPGGGTTVTAVVPTSIVPTALVPQPGS